MDGEGTEASWLQETLNSEKCHQVKGLCHQVHCCIEGFGGGMGGGWVQFFANIICWRWRRGMNGMSIVAISITRQIGATTVCENQLVGVDASDGAHHLIGDDQNSTSIWNVLG